MVRSPVWLQLGSLTAHQAWANIEDYYLVAGNQLSKILEANQYEVVIQAAEMENASALISELDMDPLEYSGFLEYQQVLRTADAHFYLNCWRIVAMNAYRIARAIPDSRLEKFLADQQCAPNRKDTGLWFEEATASITLGWYANGRDQFEHIDERIVGGRKFDKLKVDSSYIRPDPGHENLWREDAHYYPGPHFNGTHMIVGPSTWEISVAAHNQLAASVSMLLGIGESMLAEKRISESA